MKANYNLADNDIIAGIAAGICVIGVACASFLWAWSLMEPTEAERKKAAYRCALASERTDLAIAECFIEHGLEVPDDI